MAQFANLVNAIRNCNLLGSLPFHNYQEQVFLVPPLLTGVSFDVDHKFICSVRSNPPRRLQEK